MFTIQPDQSRLSRQAFLRVGALGPGGVGLPGLLRGSPSADKPWVSDQSVV